MPRVHKTRKNFMLWPYLNFLNSVTRKEKYLKEKGMEWFITKATRCYEMLRVFCYAPACVLPFLKCHLCPNNSEPRCGKVARKANWEKFCVSGLAPAQLLLTCPISGVFKSLSPAFSRAHSSPISLIKVRPTLPVQSQVSRAAFTRGQAHYSETLPVSPQHMLQNSSNGRMQLSLLPYLYAFLSKVLGNLMI